MIEKFAICGYARISVDLFEDRDNTSIENQKSIIEDFVRTRFPGSTLDIFVDRDRSGYTFEQREEYQKMRSLMLGRRYDILIVKDFSRFSRRNSRGLVELEDLRDAGMRIISIGDNIDYPNDDDWLKIQFQFLINEMPVTDTSKKIKAVIDRRQRDGKWICNVPYGYEMINYKAMTFKVDEPSAAAVRKIYELYSDGWGYKRIAEYLTEKRVPTPSMVKKDRYEVDGERSKYDSNSIWNTATVRTILSNDFYTGVLRQHKYSRVKINGRDKKLGDSENIVFEGNHEAIIDRQTFNSVQSLMAKRSTNHYHGVGKYSTKYTGILVCGDCGSPMFSRSNPRLEASYICGNYHKHGRRYCTAHHTRVDMMDSILKRYLTMVRAEVIKKADVIQAALKYENQESPQKRKATVAALQDKIEQAQKELQITKRQRIRDIVRDPDNEEILCETYDELETELCKKIDGYRSQILMCEDRSENIRRLERTTTSVIDLFDCVLAKDELSEIDLKNIVNKIYVYENHIEIELYADIERLLVSNYEIGGKGIEIERIAEDFFKEEIIHKVAKQAPKHYDIKLKEKAPFSTDVVSENGSKSINVVKEGDPLEIYTDANGEVIFKKYSPVGELSVTAKQYADVLFRGTNLPVIITDRDRVISCAGLPKKEAIERRITPSLDGIMENRSCFIADYEGESLQPVEGLSRNAAVAYPIIAGGDVSGAVVLLLSESGAAPTQTETKLIQVAASFLGKQMEE
ncbi:MAG: recombinase family protein [Clostridiales bacterium]|nr:recombinase family protein [Clostridiales bacterium]